MPRSNLAARMGHWSASHRRTALAGWIAFVSITAGAGGLLGTNTRDPDRVGVGESQRAEGIIAAGAFADDADESVLVASPSHRADDPRFQAVLADVTDAVAA